MYAIEVQNATKLYKNGVKALNALNLTVNKGEIFSLLGQNGAGKSTLINILTTFLAPTSGLITMLDKDILQHPSDIRLEIACVPQQTSIDSHLSLEENMLFQGSLYKVPKAEAKKRMSALIESFALKPYLKHPVFTYSGGIKRRLDIAMNMMSNPKILFLDEPTVGMDIQSRKTMWNMMKQIRDDFGTTIFLTTHYLEEADSLSDSICIMKEGKEVMQGTPQELRSCIKQTAIQIKFSSSEMLKKYAPILTEQFSTPKSTLQKDSMYVYTNNGISELKEISYFLLNEQIPFQGIEITQPSLENIFLLLTEK